jgi:hypothetical protein
LEAIVKTQAIRAPEEGQMARELQLRYTGNLILAVENAIERISD